MLNVNISSYYKHFSKKIAPRVEMNRKISKYICKIYFETKYRLGASKIQIILAREYGINISYGRVYRLMKALTLPKMSTVKPRFKYHKSFEESFDKRNFVNQNFNPSKPNNLWFSDISYISLKNRFVYLCVIMDAFSRKIISWKISTNMRSSLILDTLKQAVEIRKIKDPLIFHSDRGSQYLSKEVRMFLEDKKITPSYSKTAYPWDNAVVESFFKYLKKEEIHRRKFTTINEVKLSCFEYIDGFYNSRRPQKNLNNLSPNQKEDIYFNNSS